MTAAEFTARWQARRAAVRQAFQRVLRGARDPEQWRQLHLFDLGGTEERVLARRLREISYEPLLPSGGDREKSIADRLLRISNALRRSTRLDEVFRLRLTGLANAYRSTVGCYYQIEPLKPTGKKDDRKENTRENWYFQLERAEERNDEDVAWACRVASKGSPVVKTDFIVEPLYVMRRADGRQFRYVNLRNVHGETVKGASIGENEMCILNYFRPWLNRQKGGGYNWDCGANEHQAWSRDMASRLAYKFTQETSRWGWQPLATEDPGEVLPGLWVFGDGIIHGDYVTREDGRREWAGRVLRPDKNGVYWVGAGEGWVIGREDLLSAKTSEEKGEPWHQDVPLMHLLRENKGWRTARQAKWVTGYLEKGEARSEKGEEPRWSVVWNPESAPADTEHRAAVRAFYREYVTRMEETFGGRDAWLAIGQMLSFAAAPEVFARWNQWGGLWLHGEARHGKNSIMRWLCKLLGLPAGAKDGIRCESTQAGIGAALSQYANLPVWIDEYMPKLGTWVDALMKGNFNRTDRAKMTLGGARRDWLGGIVMTAQHTSPDAAIVSRYVQLQVSQNRRAVKGGKLVNHVNWFQEHMPALALIGRQVLLERGPFVQAFLREFTDFLKADDTAVLDNRSKFVYGIAWSGFAAAAEILGLELSEGAREAGRRHAIDRCAEADMEVSGRVDANLVLRDLVSALAQGELGETTEDLRRYFTAVRTGVSDFGPDGAPPRWTGDTASPFGSWTSCELYLAPDEVLSRLQAWKARQHQTLALRKSDLKSQLSDRDFWVRGGASKYFRGGTQSAWGFRLDRMPGFGRSPVDVLGLADHLLHWIGEQAGASAEERVTALNDQEAATYVLDLDRGRSDLASAATVGHPLRVTLGTAAGATRTVLWTDWDLAAWPDPRRGPLQVLAERLLQKSGEKA